MARSTSRTTTGAPCSAWQQAPAERRADPLIRPAVRAPALVVALLSLQAVLLLRTALDKADTKDEPHYLASATVQWNHPDSFGICDAPALPKWGFAAALRILDPALFDEQSHAGRHPLWSRGPLARRNLVAARAATILVVLLGGLGLWRAGRRLGAGTGEAALALWCFSPTLLANGSLATPDAWVTSWIAISAWLAARLSEKPSLQRATLLGAALALAAGSKVTALLALPVAIAMAAWIARREAARRSSRFLALASGMAAGLLFTLSALYAFRWTAIDLANLCGPPRATPGPFLPPLPFAPWIAGVIHQARHGQQGHYSYLFGEAASHGWWWFYLAALALKTTIGAQALGMARVVALWRARPGRAALITDALLLTFPVLLSTAMSLGRAQDGVRYVLPAFPLLMLWGGRALTDLPRAFPRFGRGVLAACLAAGIAESVARHPHHLMFFNLWAGGPDGGPRYLVNGDDWGQDQLRLAAWQRETRPWRLFYTAYTENPRHWGISFEAPACSPTPGYYALHAVEVHRPKRIAAGCLDWLTVEPPDARLGHSIYLYLVTRARIERLVEERARGVTPFWTSARAAPEPAEDDDSAAP